MSNCPSVISPLLHGPAAYRDRAEKLRAMAEDLGAREWQEVLLRLAKSYDDLARCAEPESCSA